MSTKAEERRIIRALGRKGLTLAKGGEKYQVRGEGEKALSGWASLEEIEIYIKLVRLKDLVGFRYGVSLKVGSGYYALVSREGNMLVRKETLKGISNWIDAAIREYRGQDRGNREKKEKKKPRTNRSLMYKWSIGKR